MLFSRVVSSVLAAAAGLVLVSSATAASPCKGLSESTCLSDDSCRWIAGYVRKDGREVSAHCRLGSTDRQSKKVAEDQPRVSVVD